jgi:hypothetical protein
VLALAGALSGCPYNPPTPPDAPEEQGDTSPITRDPACKLTGSLELVLGKGSPFSFQPFGYGLLPVVERGPQGGSHMELGVLIENPALAFPGLQVRITAQRCGEAGCERMWQYSELVLQPERFVNRVDVEEAVFVWGFRVFVDEWPADTLRRITLEATDRCGRTGTTLVEVPAGTP